jgi:tetratricopeptide (TPR) repeat protein
MKLHVYGPEAKNTDLAATLNNLGELEMKLGNYDEARLYYEQSLEMKRHVYRAESKNTDLASTLYNLGLLEKVIGNYDKAREELEEALAMAIDSLGEAASMHPLVEKIRENLEACNFQHADVFPYMYLLIILVLIASYMLNEYWSNPTLS